MTTIYAFFFFFFFLAPRMFICLFVYLFICLFICCMLLYRVDILQRGDKHLDISSTLHIYIYCTYTLPLVPIPAIAPCPHGKEGGSVGDGICTCIVDYR